MKRYVGPALAVFVLTALGCQEKLGSPTECPELCPGTSLLIRDTILTAREGLDSTYTGYLAANEVGALLVSNGISAGEARAFSVFATRSDSVLVDAVLQPYTIDSAAITINLVARDTAMHNLQLLVHRIPASVDTATSFDSLAALLTAESLIDSVQVHDTLKSGAVRLVVRGEALQRMVTNEADSGRLAIGIRVSAPGPTGVRLGSAFGSAGPPVFATYAHVNVSDTAKQRQTITLGSTIANYVIGGLAPTPSDRLFLGGKSGSRILLRFQLPAALKDSGAVIRATLELTPADSIKGLRNDPGKLQVRGVLADIGAKSPALGNIAATADLSSGATAVQQIDLASVISTWFGPNGVTQTLLLGLAPDGGTFSRPEFFSTLSGSTAPRIRLTYALPSHPGHP